MGLTILTNKIMTMIDMRQCGNIKCLQHTFIFIKFIGKYLNFSISIDLKCIHTHKINC